MSRKLLPSSAWAAALVGCMALAACQPRYGSNTSPPRFSPSTTDGTLALDTAAAPPVPPGYDTPQAAYDALARGECTVARAPSTLPDNVWGQLDVEYGHVGHAALLADVYAPADLLGPAHAIVCVHGGAWNGGSKADLRYVAVPLAAMGYVVVCVDYRLAPRATFPAAVQDVQCAVRWLRANAAAQHVDPTAIAIAGWSSGAHIALMAAYTAGHPAFPPTGGNNEVSSRVQACIDVCGPTDLTAPFAREGFGGQAAAQFLGASYTVQPELYAKASPVSYITAGTPPTLIFHGTTDDIVPIAQADALVAKLETLDVPCFYDRVPGWPHVLRTQTVSATFDAETRLHARLVYLMHGFLGQVLEP